MNYIQFFDIETSSNEKRNIKCVELENKIKMILISDSEINTSSCSVAVGAGYLQDDFHGTAHFLEHLLFMGSEKYPEQNDYHSYIQINGGYDNAFTSDNMTCYYLSLETTFLKKGIEMLSWFFRSPLLDEKHIKSEMEIIDSEHKKNILIDNWIMDDIFKNFIKINSKYRKFGTGNMKSLEKITKKDILNFYDKYYTTDNLYVCIVDSKNIETMMSEYSIYFQEIPIKLYNDENERFEKKNLETIEENIIFFNSSSEYIFINLYLIIDAIEKNNIQYQLVFFLNYLIGSEYSNSLTYNLKENDIIKNLSCLLEYFYDYQAVSNLQVILIDKNYNSFLQTIYSLNKLIEIIKNISEDEFIELYNNYRKIKILKLLYDSTSDAVSISNSVVENMIKGNIIDAVIRENYIPEYSKNVYNNFLQIINSIKIKITTNFNFKNISVDKFTKSKWYDSSYFIDNISLEIINKKTKLDNKKKKQDDKKYYLVNNKEIEKNKLFDYEFNLTNIVGIKNFIIKNYVYQDIDKNIIPIMIENNNNLRRKIFLQEYNKFNKPISNISVIRKNKKLLDKENKLVVEIYIILCEKILNYFLEIMSDYKLSFSIIINREYLIYNFYGLEYKLDYFLSQIISKIHPDVIFNNSKTKKYFEEILRDIKDSIINLKYNSPYLICSKYLSCLMDNYLLPDEKINFIKNLTFDNFENIVKNCLKYSDEYYLLTGIKKYGHSFNFYNNFEYNFYEDNYMTQLINMISLNPQKYLINNNETNENNKEQKLMFSDYKIDKEFINPKEINNCIIKYWCVENINFSNLISISDKINLDTTKKIIKQTIITSIVSEILNEPLFDKIRTVDKLGYIVKSDYKNILRDNHIYFIILFLIQSSYSTNKISSSIEEFNDYFIKDIKTNYQSYLEKFRLLKESKLIEFSKPISDITEEINMYIETITCKFFEFNLNKLFYDECEKINFEKDIEPILKHINMKKTQNFNVILEIK